MGGLGWCAVTLFVVFGACSDLHKRADAIEAAKPVSVEQPFAPVLNNEDGLDTYRRTVKHRAAMREHGINPYHYRAFEKCRAIPDCAQHIK